MLERWRELPALERTPASDAVALTFDDGPDPDATPAVLDALDAAGAQATFFLLGEQVMAHREIGRSVFERGHEVALHGYAHEDHDSLTDTAARDDIARGLGTLEAGVGVRARFYRPPYGRFSRASWEACEALDLERVYWSGWGGDWEPVPADRIASLATRDLAAGTILVLHDSARYADRESALPTAEAIPAIAERARELGLRLVTLGEALGG